MTSFSLMEEHLRLWVLKSNPKYKAILIYMVHEVNTLHPTVGISHESLVQGRRVGGTGTLTIYDKI